MKRKRAKIEPVTDKGNGVILHALMLVFAVTIVYLNSLSGVFLFDDDSAIVDNLAIRDLWSFDWFQLRGRPVTTLSLAINYAWGGLDPLGYHFVNIAIHIANSLLLYGVIAASMAGLRTNSVTSPREFAFSVALLWAVHPLCTQSVTYIIQRSESLATLGILATLYCWHIASAKPHVESGETVGDHQTPQSPSKVRSIGWFVAAVASAFFAYGSKESAAFLPFIVLLYDRVFLCQSWREVRSKAMWHGAICLPVVIGVGIYAMAFVGGTHQDQTVGFAMQRINSWSYFAAQPTVFAQYLWLSIFPIRQSLDYGWLPSEDPLTIAMGFVLWLCMVLVTIGLLIRKPPQGFIVVASLLVLAPSSSFMPLQDIIFEHRFYLPLVAVCIFLVASAKRVGDLISLRLNLRHSRWQWIFGGAVVLAFGLLTVDRNRDYSSRERMFASDAENNPENPRVWANLASVRDFDNPEDCLAMYEKSLQLYEERDFFYAGTRYKLSRAIGDIYFLTGRLEPASHYLRMALESANDDLQAGEAHFSLAMIASVLGETLESDRHFGLAIKKAGTLPGLHDAYKVHLRRTGRDAEAAALEITPRPQSKATHQASSDNR